MPVTGAEELRQAADTIADLAHWATPGSWKALRKTVVDGDDVVPLLVADCCFRDEQAEGDAAHIATWSPPVATAVAQLLTGLAVDVETVDRQNARTEEKAARMGGDGHTWVMHHPFTAHALTLARLINEARS